MSYCTLVAQYGVLRDLGAVLHLVMRQWQHELSAGLVLGALVAPQRGVVLDAPAKHHHAPCLAPAAQAQLNRPDFRGGSFV